MDCFKKTENRLKTVISCDKNQVFKLKKIEMTPSKTTIIL